ncbi:MAG: hemerythrin domain-containing protein, partial [Candidatus Bathyarchaeia archaeon]
EEEVKLYVTMRMLGRRKVLELLEAIQKGGKNIDDVLNYVRGSAGTPLELKIPQSLKVEHEELHGELEEATGVVGKVGEAARAVAEVLHPHFVKEEEFAMPPLGLLRPLAEGKLLPEMVDVLTMTDRVKSEHAQMLEEHKAIVGALKNLADVARQENKPEYEHFAQRLILHAQNEEEILYPAAILIGEYLKLKLGK